AAIFLQIVGKEQRAQQKQCDRVAENEKILSKAPYFDLGEAEFPPPEMHEHEHYRAGPGEVQGIETVPFWMLQNLGNARKQPGDAQADHHAQDDADMRKEVGRSGDLWFQWFPRPR